MQTKAHAFSLIELLIVVAIASLLMTIGVPALSNFSSKNEMSRETISLHKVLSLARSNAVLSVTQVTVCPLKNKQCDTNWNDEISAFYDQNKNRELDTEDMVFYSLPAVSNSNLTREFNRRVPVSFSPLGYAYSSAGTFKLCISMDEQYYAQTLILSAPGRIRRGSDKNQDGIDENSRGENIRCS